MLTPGGLLLAAILSLAAGMPVQAADTESGWPSFRGGPQNQGVAETTLPDEPELLWEHETVDGITATAAIHAGRVYVGTLSGNLLCLKLSDGSVVWTYRSVDEPEPNSFPPGFNAPATIGKDTVYIGDEDGVFHAVDRQTGKGKWRFETDGEIVGGATLVGDQVLFGSHDMHLYSLNAKTGEKTWSYEAEGPVQCTPAIAGKYTFITGCDRELLRIVNIETGKEEFTMPISSLMVASVAVKDEHLYFGTHGGTVAALNWKEQLEDWTYADPVRQQEIQSSPAVNEKYVVIGSRDKNVHCFDRSSGDLLWSFPTRAGVDSSPVIVGDRVFFGSRDKNVYGVRLADGELSWKYPVRQSITASPAVAEQHLVIGSDQPGGKLFCFGAKKP